MMIMIMIMIIIIIVVIITYRRKQVCHGGFSMPDAVK